MEWGNRVHKALELRVKDGTALPETIKAYEPIAAKIIASGQGGQVFAEQKLGLDHSFEPTTFFARDVYVRIITDVTIVKGRKAKVLDYKTGKEQPASAQLRLCAGATFAHYPEVEEVVTGYLWLASGRVTPEVYTRDQLPEIWQTFLPRVQKLEKSLDTNHWPKNPSGLCRKHCPVKACEHNGDYRG
jgi:hypothetical protein